MSLDELRAAIRAWLDEYDSRPFRKRDDSGRSESEERPLLIPLLETAYEAADWIHGRKARSNVQLPRRVRAQLVFGPVRVRRLRRGPARRPRHARGIRTLHAPATAREDRMEAMGPGTLRAVGAPRRPGHDRRAAGNRRRRCRRRLGAWRRLLCEHGQVSAMIIDSGTKRKPRGMNAAGPLDAFERLDERTVMPLSMARGQAR